MKHIEAIFFDFDGVIVESLDIKGWAFKKLFERYPEHTDKIVEFHHAHAGMSRFDKFRYIYKEIIKQPLPDKTFDELCSRFSSIVYDRVVKCKFVPGALEFLKKYHRTIRCFIVSATPHDEINKIASARGLDQYVKGVFGSPSAKSYWVNMIVDEWKFNLDNLIFVGDAISDYEAATKNNIRFIARIVNADNPFVDKKVDHKIRDLFDLENYITQEC